MIFESRALPKFVNLITFLQKLISKEHVVVIMEFPDWVQFIKKANCNLSNMRNQILDQQEALSSISSVGQWAYTEYSSFSGPPKGE